MPAVLSIGAGYLLGSVSSAWIIVRLFGKEDMRSEPDGSISAASVYYKLGFLPYALTALMDIALGATAVLLSRAVTHSNSIAMLAGLAAMAGHNWSIFLKFKGGLGATAMAGALVAVMPAALFYGLVVAGLFHIFAHRAGWGTAVGIFTIFIAALIQKGPGAVAVYPLSLFSLMLVKRLQLARAAGRNILGSAK